LDYGSIADFIKIAIQSLRFTNSKRRISHDYLIMKIEYPLDYENTFFPRRLKIYPNALVNGNLWSKTRIFHHDWKVVEITQRPQFFTRKSIDIKLMFF